VGRLAIVDHDESYGRHLLEKWIKRHAEVCDINTAVDLGCGQGKDLELIKNICEKRGKEPKLIGIDYMDRNTSALRKRGIDDSIKINIEQNGFPFENESVDLFIANQVLEHCKEIYWINHEVFRCLKINGCLFIGVPNIVSLHNRILSALGFHPTNWKSLSAHVRIFSRKDVYQFYTWIGKDFLRVKCFGGSQFYPFPKKMSRALSSLFPNMAYSIFFLIEKTGKYSAQFLDHPIATKLETNFYVGENKI
jgi:SAM-dependent methyltransferase